MYVTIFVCFRPSKPNHYQVTMFIFQCKAVSIRHAYLESFLYYLSNLHKAGWSLFDLKVGRM